MGPSNSISCPDGYAKITSEDECSKAAKYYNWPYYGKIERDDLPGNCFMGPYPQVYLNSVVGTGSSLEKGWEPMCIRRPETNIVLSVAGSATNDIAESHDVNLVANAADSNMLLRASSMDGWPFQMGPSNSISCPDGYAKITSEDECSKAAKYYNWPYSGKVERDDLPGNCFMGPYPHVYLNTVIGTGSSLEKGWEPMCIKRP